jgi:oligoribonuclease NrnB/cAMP/cGMP phosphodiesterase (DHH superfamily)
MLCIYHFADHDGKGSAAIVNKKFKGVEFFGLNHDMEVPYDKIKMHDKIIVCDISLPMDLMFELNETKDLTWIDHHASMIEEYEKRIAEGAKEIKGLRRNGTAAIMLTWEYFFSDEAVPEGVKLLALNDVFDLRDYRVRPFEYAFQAMGVNRPTDQNWKDLLASKLDIDEMVSNLAITQNMSNNLKTTFNKVVVLVDSYIDKKNIRQYQDLMDSFVGGFCNGLKNNINTKTLGNQRRDLDYFVLNNFEI